MRNAVVYIGMTYPQGIIRHFVLLAVEINKIFKTVGDIDFFFASTDGETNQNAWPIVHAEFGEDRIIKDGDFGMLVRRICNLTGRYENVIVHTGGGWGQTKHFVREFRHMDKRLVSRLHLVGTTHSFRNASLHRFWMSTFQSLLYLLYYDKIVFQCRYAADIFTGSSLLFKLGKGVIIPLGCEEFQATEGEAPEYIDRVGLVRVCKDASLFKMIYLAQFRPGKMHIWLVKTLAPVLKKNQNARLILCGMGAKDVIEKVREVVVHERIDHQVLMPGQIPRCEIPWLLGHVHCALVPSRSETFGHNFVEPMFAHLPVVGTRVGIGREIIEDGKTGFTFSLKHPKQLRDAVSAMIKDPDMTKRMGDMAYERVRTTFRHGDVARQLVDLYCQVLNGK